MLWATFIGGGTMAAFLIYSRNPFVPILAHFSNNLASLRGVVINASVFIGCPPPTSNPHGDPIIWAVFVVILLAVMAVQVATTSAFKRHVKSFRGLIINQDVKTT
jgi:membrane protease YdiL (CAAX protease family)